MNWGNWSLNADMLQLEHPNYEVYLGDLHTNAAVMDWIFQLLPKSWHTAEDMKNFLQALDDIFTPQETLCGGGSDRRIADPGSLVREYAANQ